MDQSRTILVVNDDMDIRKLLQQELEAEGCHVQEASNGAEAIAQIKDALLKQRIVKI